MATIFQKLMICAGPKVSLNLHTLSVEIDNAHQVYNILQDEEKINWFIAQTAHETCGFLYMSELGNSQYFKKYDPGTSIGKRLGNKNPGDGARYKGRGLIQLTGRYNYKKFSEWANSVIGTPPNYYIDNPDKILSNPALPAFWYWKERGLENCPDYKTLTKKINGGLNGYKDRVHKLELILDLDKTP